MHIRNAIQNDAAAIGRIYAHYVDHTTISMEETAPNAQAMGERIAAIQAGGLPWIVAEVDGALAGYAYASQWRARPGYRFAVESSVYLDKDCQRRGLGSALYRELLARLRALGMHTVIGGIALPNPASVALHEKLGFRQVACFREVGTKFGGWVDVGYWQLQLHTPA